MKKVRAKKKLGQHFLNDQYIAEKIVNSLQNPNKLQVVEIGPGTGVLTKYLFEKDYKTFLIEVDDESVIYLNDKYPEHRDQILNEDFLKFEYEEFFESPICVIGNFPYNISSQIFFRILKTRNFVPEIVCMIQKEVAERLASKPGKKAYGILSVFLQAYYNIEYLFTVEPHVFTPPPKVKSGVIRLVRNERQSLDCNEDLFFKVVKATFLHRRKTIRNSIKAVAILEDTSDPIFTQRPEQLSVEEFVYLTNIVDSDVL